MEGGSQRLHRADSPVFGAVGQRDRWAWGKGGGRRGKGAARRRRSGCDGGYQVHRAVGAAAADAAVEAASSTAPSSSTDGAADAATAFPRGSRVRHRQLRAIYGRPT